MAYSTNEFALGTVAPDFALLDTVSDKLISLHDAASNKATVIMFICNHCPYVKHILPQVVELAKEYQQQGVSFVAVNANNAAESPEDGPEQMKALATELGFSFPYLYDQTQLVARSFHAEYTPEFYVFDRNMRLAYHGQFDDARPKNELPVTGQDLRHVLDDLLQGRQPAGEQKPGIGCGIKWKRRAA